MNYSKKSFNQNSEEEKLKITLDSIKEANEIIEKWDNPKTPPSKDVFIKALSEIEDIKGSPSLSQETQKSLEKFQKTCVQEIALILHSEGTIPFQKGDYKRTAEILEDLRKLIVKHCEIFDIERSKLVNFIQYMKNDINSNPKEEISLKSLKPMKIKYKDKVREYFDNEIAITSIEMLVDAIVISSVCNHMIKNHLTA